MEELMNLVNKEMVTLEELTTILESEYVTNLEDCGMSGRYYGKHWYVATIDNEEYDLYA